MAGALPVALHAKPLAFGYADGRVIRKTYRVEHCLSNAGNLLVGKHHPGASFLYGIVCAVVRRDGFLFLLFPAKDCMFIRQTVPAALRAAGARCYNRAGGEVFLARTDVDFSRGSIPKTILRLSLPMIAAQIINALYSMVDRMFIGRIPEVGSQALTGVGVTFPFIMIISAFAALAGMGGAPLLSIARGEGRDEYGAQIIATPARCCLSLAWR